MSYDSVKPIVNKVTSTCISLQIFASKELSNPPEKAIAREFSLPTACSTAAKSAFFRVRNNTKYFLLITTYPIIFLSRMKMVLTICLHTFVFGLFVHILGWTHESEKSEMTILLSLFN
ncbi:MAG TPA: hypothetical protein VIL14_02000 [Nitrososphaeraceae archaeon]